MSNDATKQDRSKKRDEKNDVEEKARTVLADHLVRRTTPTPRPMTSAKI